MTQATKLFTEAQIGAEVVKVQKAAGKLQDHIHKVACSILSIWSMEKSDNKDRAQWAAKHLTDLQNASPYHAAAFAKWVAMFCPLQWAEENKVWFAHAKEDTRLMGKVFIAARETPFWKVSPPKEAKPFDMAEEIAKLLAKADKHLKTKVEGDKIDMAALTVLRDVNAKLKAQAEAGKTGVIA